MKRNLLVLFLLVGMALSLAGCGRNGTQSIENTAEEQTQTGAGDSEVQEQEQASTENEEAAVDSQDAGEKISLEELGQAFAYALLSSSNPYKDVDVAENDNVLTMNVQSEGISSVVKAIQDGSYDADNWNVVRNSTSAVVEEIVHVLEEQGYNDAHLVFNLVNEQNPDETFIAFHDAEIVYDIIEDVGSNGIAANTDVEPHNEDSSQEEVTTGQCNALSKAGSYLKSSAFSHDGLIGQLEYSGFTHEEAVYAADNCGADWNEQALRKAGSYLSTSAFSYSGLIDQLEYSEFTHEQAVYGADNCGADWNEQAARKAASYLKTSSFSRSRLIEQLEYSGFTHEQAEYGASQNGY